MQRMTQAEVDLHNLRVSKPNRIPVPEDAVSDESELQSDIRKYCNGKGWMCFGGSMAHRTRRTPGEPDMYIVGSRTCGHEVHPLILLIECKTKRGKLSPDQQAVAAGCAKHRVTVHVVRSMSEFTTLVNWKEIQA